jgi:hypothetical protein
MENPYDHGMNGMGDWMSDLTSWVQGVSADVQQVQQAASNAGIDLNPLHSPLVQRALNPAGGTPPIMAPPPASGTPGAGASNNNGMFLFIGAAVLLLALKAKG